MSKYVVVANFTQYEDNDRTLDSKIRSVGTADSIKEAIQITKFKDIPSYFYGLFILLFKIEEIVC